MTTVCFTSFSFAYLSRARVLAQTVKAAHPDWIMLALVVDVPPPALDLAASLAPFDTAIRADSLAIPDFPRWMFKHDLVEACTAVKATMLERLVAEGADTVIYLDPDIAVFHPLTEIERLLETASIILTPHQTAPNNSSLAIADNELTTLQYGLYNLGFAAVRNDAAGQAFAAWWAKMTRQACYDDPQSGIFTDQKYCDLVPSLFDRVLIHRDPGCNVASWNLSRRTLTFDPSGNALVNGSPLKFYHFTKINGVGDTMTERYAGDQLAVYELVNWYKRELTANGFPHADSTPWAYGSFATGRAIPRAVRLLWRTRPDLVATFNDPFAGGRGSFQSWLEIEMPALLPPASAMADPSAP